MGKKLKDSKNDGYLADLEAHRTGEPCDLSDESPFDGAWAKEAMDDLKKISTRFREAKPENTPEDLDRLVFAQISRHAERIRRERKGIRSFRWSLRPVWAAAACAVVIFGVSLSLYWGQNNSSQYASSGSALKPTSRMSEDIDPKGTRDIVDAYLMARKIRSGGQVSMQWDLNHDGKVDQEDVQIVARRAVAIGEGGV